MTEPIPKIREKDLERIIKREFPNHNFKKILKLLNRHKSNRVKIAAIKNSNGDIEKLEREINNAKHDYREVILNAEYPSSGKNKTKDQRQYQEWLIE